MATSIERARILTNEDRKLRFDLIRIREASGISIHDMGELLGEDDWWANEFEQIDANPKLSDIRRYAHTLGVVIRHTISEE